MRYVFLSLFAVLAYTTAMCVEPEQTGYTHGDIAGMDRLLDQVLVKPPEPERHHRLGTEDAQAALQELGY